MRITLTCFECNREIMRDEMHKKKRVICFNCRAKKQREYYIKNKK